MAKVEKFEDLDAFKRGRSLCALVFEVTSERRLTRNYRLASQMQAAAVSIISNIAEGFERGRVTEFHQFCSIAKGSCAELRAQLYDSQLHRPRVQDVESDYELDNHILPLESPDGQYPSTSVLQYFSTPREEP